MKITIENNEIEVENVFMDCYNRIMEITFTGYKDAIDFELKCEKNDLGVVREGILVRMELI